MKVENNDGNEADGTQDDGSAGQKKLVSTVAGGAILSFSGHGISSSPFSLA